jgi:hypothetical protein
MEGVSKGEICNRNGCTGIIDEHEKEGSCSCHIHPPCGYCETDKSYCPVCDWSAEEERAEYEKEYSKNTKPFEYKQKTFADLDRTKIDWITESHTHFTMKKKGVYPEGATRQDVIEKVKGTFGGRFNKFDNGEFEYIAYTD